MLTCPTPSLQPPKCQKSKKRSHCECHEYDNMFSFLILAQRSRNDLIQDVRLAVLTFLKKYIFLENNVRNGAFFVINAFEIRGYIWRAAFVRQSYAFGTFFTDPNASLFSFPLPIFFLLPMSLILHGSSAQKGGNKSDALDGLLGGGKIREEQPLRGRKLWGRRRRKTAPWKSDLPSFQ